MQNRYESDSTCQETFGPQCCWVRQEAILKQVQYYKDKIKTVLCSFIYYRSYFKEASKVKVPSMLIADLENQTLIFYQIDKNWYAIDKVNESDVPSSIEAIKDGTITDYINSINYFKVRNCLMHRISLSHHECIPA